MNEHRPPSRRRSGAPGPDGTPKRKHGNDSTDDWTWAFVMQLLRTGLMLHGLLCDLSEDLPEDAFAGEDNGAVLIEMLAGTIRPAAEAAGAQVVRDATALLEASSTRTIEDLRAALALRVAMDRGLQNQG